jgi:hypothetical protein
MDTQPEPSSLASAAAGDLDAQKLTLERDKLAFEIRKFESDQTNRKLEARKLAAEVLQLRRPWYWKAAYLGPLSTITVAIVGGLIASGTDFLKDDVIKINKDRDKLSQDVQGLRSIQTQLSAQNAGLEESEKRRNGPRCRHAGDRRIGLAGSQESHDHTIDRVLRSRLRLVCGCPNLC